MLFDWAASVTHESAQAKLEVEVADTHKKRVEPVATTATVI